MLNMVLIKESEFIHSLAVSLEQILAIADFFSFGLVIDCGEVLREGTV